MKDNNERRDFIKKASAVFTFGVFASSFGAVVNSCEKDEVQAAPEPETIDIDLAPFPKLANPGGFAMVKITLKTGAKVDVIVNRLDQSSFSVLDSTCRHLGCQVTLPDTESSDIICYCHNVQFNLRTGAVTVKPIPDAVPGLTKYKVFAYDQAKNILQIVV